MHEAIDRQNNEARTNEKAVVLSARQPNNDKRYLGNEYRFEYFGEVSEQASFLTHTPLQIIDSIDSF
jgi:hypothetical protein